MTAEVPMSLSLPFAVADPNREYRLSLVDGCIFSARETARLIVRSAY
jgi:hypothetical protein